MAWPVSPSVFLNLALGFALGASPAHAGAWTEEAGSGKVISTSRLAVADRAFDSQRQSTRATDFRKDGAEVYIAQGVADGVTVLLQTGYVNLQAGGQYLTGWEDTQIGVQKRILQDDQQAASVSVSGFVPGDSSLTSGGVDGELRLLYGRSFEIGGKPAYVNFETGYRWRANGFADQVRPDVTFGWSASKRLTLLAQSFNTIAMGDGASDYEGEQNKAQASALWAASKAVSLQLGAFATMGGANTPRERGVFASLWMNF